MRSSRDGVRDVVAIGCGPFNLGLAALASTVPELELRVFDDRPELCWHRGLMFDDAELQLSFLADLVSLVEPAHPLSFLAYLRDADRLYAFYIREAFHPTRREYEAYLRWVSGKLPSVHFSHHVTRVTWDALQSLFLVKVRRADGSELEERARHLVLGIGTEPWLPDALAGLPQCHVLHSSEYLHRLSDVRRASHVSVVGSGQSGAETLLDLLRQNVSGGGAVSWLTRSRAFAPLDYTKLVLEMTTPAYVRYFHGLPQATKDRLVAEQWQHYKGISSDTLRQIHALLYERELLTPRAPVELRCGVSVEWAELDSARRVRLGCRACDSGARFEHQTDLVVAATGYRERHAAFLEPLEPLIRRDERGRYRVRIDHSIELDPAVSGQVFVANADLHSHGVAAPDLGICAYRNATILNTIAGREVYRLPQKTAFTSFAPPAPTVPPARPSLAPFASATMGRADAFELARGSEP
jgi:lysine N6-hydroxylase